VLIQPDRRGKRVSRFLLDDDRALLRAKISALHIRRWRAQLPELLAAHNDALRARGLSPASMPEDPSLDAVPVKANGRHSRRE